MKESVYKSYDELPLFFNAELVGRVLGISSTTAYEMVHRDDFPSIKIGNRLRFHIASACTKHQK